MTSTMAFFLQPFFFFLTHLFEEFVQIETCSPKSLYLRLISSLLCMHTTTSLLNDDNIFSLFFSNEESCSKCGPSLLHICGRVYLQCLPEVECLEGSMDTFSFKRYFQIVIPKGCANVYTLFCSISHFTHYF